jgi:hypothetical protein
MNVVPSPDSTRGRFALLAPAQAIVPGNFRQVDRDQEWHRQMLKRAQRLRGKVYLDEGAIGRSELSPDGRHRVPIDEHAWHVLALDEGRQIYGCSRYMAHPNSTPFSGLNVANCPLAKSRTWGARFRDAVESEIELAQHRGIAYVEVGGWALIPDLRRSVEALRIALATFSLARTLGGCIGIATATQRHASSSILRRIGGRPLTSGGVDLPAYYDPQYGCDMELVRFDSSEPNSRFEAWIVELSDYLRMEPVIHREYAPSSPVRSRVPAPENVGFEPSLATAV